MYFKCHRDKWAYENYGRVNIWESEEGKRNSDFRKGGRIGEIVLKEK